jgi:hypothetical protein
MLDVIVIGAGLGIVAALNGKETLNLMMLKTEPERIATIRRMAALPDRPRPVTDSGFREADRR